jgi:hypothetical protein
LRPQLPGDWNTLRATGIPAGDARFDLLFERGDGVRRFELTGGGASLVRVALAPAIPLDARVREVTVNERQGRFNVERQGDSQFVRIDAAPLSARTAIVIRLDEGTEVYRRIDAAPIGARSRGLRVLRVRPDSSTLALLLDGTAGERYTIDVRTPRQLGALPEGVKAVPAAGNPAHAGSGVHRLELSFDGKAGEYVRRDIVVPLR